MFSGYRFKLLAACSVLVFALACGEDDPPQLNGENQQDQNQNQSATNDDNDGDETEHNHSNPPDEPECVGEMTQPDACGGHVEGNWDNGEICTDFTLEDELDQICPSAEVHQFDYWLAEDSGTVQFDDGTFERDLRVVVDLDMHIPQQCIDMLEEMAPEDIDCPTLAAYAEDYVGISPECEEPDDSDDEEGPGCDCWVDEREYDRSITADYEASQETGVITVDGSEDYYYCAEDGVLNMRLVESDDDEIPMTEAYTWVE